MTLGYLEVTLLILLSLAVFMGLMLLLRFYLITYFYLDTKINFENIPENTCKAEATKNRH